MLILKAYTRKHETTNEMANDKSAQRQTRRGLFTQQCQFAKTLIKAGVVSSLPPIRVCVIVCVILYLNTAHGYVNNCRW